MTTREGKAIPFQAVLPTYAGGVQEGDVTPVVIYDQSGGTIGADEPLVYAALVTQASTAAPVATVAKNSTGTTITWARTNVGIYTATASVATFTADKTIMLTGSDNVSIVRTSTTVLTITTTADDGVSGIPAPADGVLSGTSIKVEIYP